MEIGEKFLPIGTVVLLKNGKKELMIVAYGINPSKESYDKNGKVDVSNKVFDYGAFPYPEGMITSDQILIFNHDQIERVSFMGYQTDTQKELSKLLNGARDEIKKLKQQLENKEKENTNTDDKKED